MMVTAAPIRNQLGQIIRLYVKHETAILIVMKARHTMNMQMMTMTMVPHTAANNLQIIFTKVKRLLRLWECAFIIRVSAMVKLSMLRARKRLWAVFWKNVKKKQHPPNGEAVFFL